MQLTITRKNQLLRTTALIIGTIFITLSVAAALFALVFYWWIPETKFLLAELLAFWYSLALCTSVTLLLLEVGIARYRQRNLGVLVLCGIAAICEVIMLGITLITLKNNFVEYIHLWEHTAMFGIIFMLNLWSFVELLRTRQNVYPYPLD